MKKKQFLWLMIAIGILSTGSGCDSVKPVSTTQEIPTAEETNLVTTVPISEGEQPAETTTVPQIADVLTTAATTPTTTGEEYRGYFFGGIADGANDAGTKSLSDVYCYAGVVDGL